jgi:hypothetical protein
MQPMPVLAVSALLVFGSGSVAAANSARIAETGAFLLGNAYRCGVADARVVRAGRVIRELIAAASDAPGDQVAAKSRFAEIFRASAQPEGDGHRPAPSCKMIMTQFERLEHFHDQVGVR